MCTSRMALPYACSMPTRNTTDFGGAPERMANTGIGGVIKPAKRLKEWRAGRKDTWGLEGEGTSNIGCGRRPRPTMCTNCMAPRTHAARKPETPQQFGGAPERMANTGIGGIHPAAERLRMACREEGRREEGRHGG